MSETKKYKCVEETMAIFENGGFGVIPKDAIVELVSTRKMPHDNKEWLQLKYMFSNTQGFMNPKDFEELK